MVGQFTVNAITDLILHDGVVQFNIDNQCWRDELALFIGFATNDHFTATVVQH